MAKFRKQPEIIEAVQWQATNASWKEIVAMGCPTKPGIMGTDSFIIPTLEGEITVSKSDWVIQGIDREFYLCEDDIFKKTYEPVE